MKKIFVLFLITVALAACSNNSSNNENTETDGRGLGLVFDDNGYEKMPLRAKQTRGIYTVEVAHSIENFCPEVESQGSYGTCVGWSTAYYGRTILFARSMNMTDIQTITQNTFSPSFVYKYVEVADDNCDNGTQIESALDVMKIIGAVKFADFAEPCPANVPDELLQKAAEFKIEDYVRLFDINTEERAKIDAVKKAISEDNPVIIGFQVTESFTITDTEVWQSSGETDVLGGHAMCVVGYNDTKLGGAFRIINSWGKDWGDNGYIWISYPDFAQYTKYAFEMIGNIVEPNQQNEMSGKIRFVGENGQEMPAIFTQQRGIVVVSASGEGNYRLQNPYQSGTRFRLHIFNNQPAYVYAIACDNNMGINILFPYDAAISPLLNYSQNEVALPDETHLMQLDNTTGTDLFCLLYATEPLDIEQIKNNILQASGTFSQRLTTVLSDKLVAPNEINYSNSEMAFDAKSNKTVLPIIVSITHN